MPKTSRSRRTTGRLAIIDTLMMATAILSPLTTLPQAVQIFATHTAAGVSLLSWAAFLIFNAIGAIYGAIHRLKPIVIANGLLVVIDMAIVVGTLIYGP